MSGQARSEERARGPVEGHNAAGHRIPTHPKGRALLAIGGVEAGLWTGVHRTVFSWPLTKIAPAQQVNIRGRWYKCCVLSGEGHVGFQGITMLRPDDVMQRFTP